MTEPDHVFELPEGRIELYLITFPEGGYCRQKLDASVRSLLSKWLNRLPETIQWLPQKKGKPRLIEEQNELGLDFNLSHSGQWAVLGISIPKTPLHFIDIGVDIERNRRVDYLKIANRFFAPEEYQKLTKSPDATRLFFELWTQKEAYVKTFGETLGSRLKIPVRTMSQTVKFWTKIQAAEAHLPLKSGTDGKAFFQKGKLLIRVIANAYGEMKKGKARTPDLGAKEVYTFSLAYRVRQK